MGEKLAIMLSAEDVTEARAAPRPTSLVRCFYAAIEQDGWLQYVNGAIPGLLGGAVHILIFGA